jgi:hypothetical protein
LSKARFWLLYRLGTPSQCLSYPRKTKKNTLLPTRFNPIIHPKGEHMSTTIEERFWEKVIKTGECWLWTGARHRKHWDSVGYGVMGINKKNVFAHRLSYELHHGTIPTGMLVRHTCDNSLCVNPDHLILGTDADNAQDKVDRGRASGARQLGKHCTHMKNYCLTEFGTSATHHYVQDGELWHESVFGDYTGKYQFTCRDCGEVRQYTNRSMPNWLKEVLALMVR